MQYLELAANGFFVASVILAARNNIHTWWLGIIGCVLFAILYFQVKLYADSTLMLFYIGTSVYGWWHWSQGESKSPIVRTQGSILLVLGFAAVITTAGYGSFLFLTTDAYAPFIDSAVLMFSVLAQFLLMKHRLETWWFWILVDTIAVPLYASRELYLTSVIYLGFWFNAWYGLYVWKRKYQEMNDEIKSF